MSIVNTPIQAFSVTSTQGDITPVLFKLEDESHQIHTIRITEVLSRKDVHFCGVDEIQFTCKAQVLDCEKFFILKYNVHSHKWTFFKML